MILSILATLLASKFDLSSTSSKLQCIHRVDYAAGMGKGRARMDKAKIRKYAMIYLNKLPHTDLW